MKFWVRNQSSIKTDPAMLHANGLPEVNSWTISNYIIDKIIPVVGVHPYPLSELQLMISAVCWLKPKIIIEWGTHIGVSARIFSETTEHFGYNSIIYSIDLPPDVYHVENPKNERGKLVKNCKNVELILGDSIKIAKSMSDMLGKEKILFFLDGDHQYETVLRELNMIGKYYKNASILLHDTYYQKAISGYNIGPYFALKKYLSSNKKHYKMLSTTFGLPGMTLLIKNNLT